MDCSFKRQKKEISTVNAFQKILLEERKPNKIWVNQGGEGKYNEGKSVVAQCI